MDKYFKRLKASGIGGFLITISAIVVTFLAFILSVKVSDENLQSVGSHFNKALNLLIIYLIFCLLPDILLIIFSRKEKKFKNNSDAAKRYLNNNFKIFIFITSIILSLLAFVLLFLVGISNVNYRFDLYIPYICYLNFIICCIGILSLYIRSIMTNLIQIKKIEYLLENERMKKFKNYISVVLNYLYGKTRFYTRFYSTIVLSASLGIVGLYFLMNTEYTVFNTIYEFTTSIVILVAMFANLISIKIKPEDKYILEKLDVNNINIDNESIFKLPIYILKSSRINPDYQLFQIDVSSLTQSSEILSLYIQEAFDPIILNGDDIANHVFLKILILYDVNSYEMHHMQRLRINIAYKDEDKRKFRFLGKKEYNYRYFDILLCFCIYSNIVIPVEKFQLNFKQRKFKKAKIVKRIKSFSYGEYNNDKQLKDMITHAAPDVYFFNDLENNVDLNMKVSEDRKVLLHNGTFGSGKTTYDILSIVNQNKIPIVISPWEANYDHDIIYLIFDTIRSTTATKKFTFLKGNYLFFFAIVSAIFSLGKDFIFSCFDGLLTIVSLIVNALFFKIDEWNTTIMNIDTYGSSIKTIFYFLFFICLTWRIYKRIVPNIIIYKKDYTQIYKNFFIKSIVEMLSINSNYVLLVEDVDRLNVKTQEEVFRILSSMNSNFPNSSRLFCLLSYDKKAPSNLDNNIDYEVINNKIIYQNWGVSHDSKKSMFMYVLSNLKIIQSLLHHSESYTGALYELKNKIYNGEFNFRDLHTVFQIVNSDYEVYAYPQPTARIVDDIIMKAIQMYEERLRSDLQSNGDQNS